MHKQLIGMTLLILMVISSCGQKMPDMSRPVYIRLDPTDPKQLMDVLTNTREDEEIVLGSGDFTIPICKGLKFDKTIHLTGQGVNETSISCMDDYYEHTFWIRNAFINGITFNCRLEFESGIITDNRFMKGLMIIEGSGTVSNNIIRKDFEITYADNVKVFENQISGSENGIDLYQSSHINIYNNHIYKNRQGISVSWPKGVSIFNNIIEGNYFGISITFYNEENRLEIFGNKLSDNSISAMYLAEANYQDIGFGLPSVIYKRAAIEYNWCSGDGNMIYLLRVPRNYFKLNPGCTFN